MLPFGSPVALPMRRPSELFLRPGIDKCCGFSMSKGSSVTYYKMAA